MSKETTEEKRTQMNIALTAEDKRFLKIYAAERDISVAAVIHELIEKLRKEASGNA